MCTSCVHERQQGENQWLKGVAQDLGLNTILIGKN